MISRFRTVDLVECYACEGRGGVEGPNCCTFFCGYCGGCFEERMCDVCDGRGEIAEECDDCGSELVQGDCKDCLETELEAA